MASILPVLSASAQTSQNYTFPRHRLRLSQNDPTRTPLVLVACGSFSPLTFLHLRMFEMVCFRAQECLKIYSLTYGLSQAADFAKFNTEFEILGGYLVSSTQLLL
jgi:nicotinamide mononucleotide adenylyltransferase